MALNEFLAWFKQAPRPGFTKATVSAWRVSLEDRKLGSSSIIIRMSAIRKLAAGISRVKSAKCVGIRVGNWLSVRQAQALLNAPDATTLRGLLRAPAVRGGGAHVRTRPAAGRSLVHRRPSRQARPRPDRTNADVGEDCD
jgi:hypothetical protein